MSHFTINHDGLPSEQDPRLGYSGDPGESVTLRITNEAAENGYEQDPGPLTWLNSARITTDPDDDAVHCLVSVGDPRGAFCFTVRRMKGGMMVIHMPCPDEPMPHLDTRYTHSGPYDGTIIVKGDFSDPEPESD